MITKWKVTEYSDRPQKENIEWETEHAVFCEYGGLQQKDDGDSYFDTWEEAREHLLKQKRKRVMKAQRKLNFEKEVVKFVSMLEEPKGKED